MELCIRHSSIGGADSCLRSDPSHDELVDFCPRNNFRAALIRACVTKGWTG
jgi:hypothetical protein